MNNTPLVPLDGTTPISPLNADEIGTMDLLMRGNRINSDLTARFGEHVMANPNDVLITAFKAEARNADTAKAFMQMVEVLPQIIEFVKTDDLWRERYQRLLDLMVVTLEIKRCISCSTWIPKDAKFCGGVPGGCGVRQSPTINAPPPAALGEAPSMAASVAMHGPVIRETRPMVPAVGAPSAATTTPAVPKLPPATPQVGYPCGHQGPPGNYCLRCGVARNANPARNASSAGTPPDGTTPTLSGAASPPAALPMRVANMGAATLGMAAIQPPPASASQQEPFTAYVARIDAAPPLVAAPAIGAPPVPEPAPLPAAYAPPPTILHRIAVVTVKAFRWLLKALIVLIVLGIISSPLIYYYWFMILDALGLYQP